jgi:hypothetical protein
VTDDHLIQVLLVLPRLLTLVRPHPATLLFQMRDSSYINSNLVLSFKLMPQNSMSKPRLAEQDSLALLHIHQRLQHMHNACTVHHVSFHAIAE